LQQKLYTSLGKPAKSSPIQPLKPVKSMFVVAAFYHFFDFARFEAERAGLQALLKQWGVHGSMLIAPEGINATIAGSREGVDAVLTYVAQLIGEPVEHKESYANSQPFTRGKVRLKKELISLGPYVAPTRTGTYIEPKDWNALIDDPETLVLDTRNAYETHMGTFARAIDPNIANFKQLPEFVEKNLAAARSRKIATFCTGGIRCEKFTAWLLEQGFEQVYHLKGGILKYLEEVQPEQSRWQGECYVFDHRVAVGHGLAQSTTASMCLACGHALKPEDREHPAYEKDITCPFCFEVKRKA